MFKEGEKVINNNGVACIIDRIEKMKIPHSKIHKNYYIMHDILKKDNVYYIPVESESSMRYPITKEDAKSLIKSISSIEKITVGPERFRDEEYRKCLRGSDPTTLIAMLKFFADRKVERANSGKTLSAVDEKYMKLATRNLYSELSCSLEASVDEVEAIINENIA